MMCRFAAAVIMKMMISGHGTVLVRSLNCACRVGQNHINLYIYIYINLYMYIMYVLSLISTHGVMNQ